MSELQLFAVEEIGPVALSVPESARSFDDLYTEVSLGVYSSLRTFEHNKFLYLDHHLARTVQSMQLSGWSYEWDEGALRQALHTVCTAYPSEEMRVRIDLLAEPAERLGTESRSLIGLMPFTPIDPALYATGVSVAFAEGLIRDNPLIKAAAFTQQRKAYQTGGANIYEHLLVENDGRILEGTSSNFYAIRDGVVYTAGERILEGITRRILLDLMADLAIPVKFEPIHVDDIGYLDEAAISSSSRALLSVIRIAGQSVGEGKPGPICQQILEAYQVFVHREIRAAIE